MCARISVLPAGIFEIVDEKFAVAAVIAFDELRVRLNVIVTLPVAVVSAPVTAGTSFAAERFDVNTIVFGFSGSVGLSSHAAAPNAASVIATRTKRFVFIT